MEENTSLEFNTEKHIYKIDNRIIPSVSEILKPLSSLLYDTILDSILENAKKRGSEIHKAIELYNKYKFDNIREEYKLYFDAYKKWYENRIIKNIECEVQSYNKTFNYAGTCDMILNNHTLIDIKTTSELDLNYVSVQCSAYKASLNSQGYKITNMYVLWLKKDGTFSYIRLEDNLNIFLSCLIIYNYIKKGGK